MVRSSLHVKGTLRDLRAETPNGCESKPGYCQVNTQLAKPLEKTTVGWFAYLAVALEGDSVW